MHLPFEEVISWEMGTPCLFEHVNRVGGRESCSAFLSFFISLVLIFLETVRGRGVAAAGGSNCYNQSYFQAKN